MTSASKRKGSYYEWAAARALVDELGIEGIRPALGAGRKDDRGDLVGLPSCVVQVRALARVGEAIRTSVRDAERQRVNDGARWAVGMVPVVHKGKRVWLCCTGIDPDEPKIPTGCRWHLDRTVEGVVREVANGLSSYYERAGCVPVLIHPLATWAAAYRESALAAGLL